MKKNEHIEVKIMAHEQLCEVGAKILIFLLPILLVCYENDFNCNSIKIMFISTLLFFIADFIYVIILKKRYIK